ncbi:hypothetical protein LY13_005083 [Prauserella aidingensis]|uniref:hypothetical protein n=1 Tax=Prauserella aidingensis TaxID=387890 RepID=UPI0020A38E6F|nr:hypothetical protein [Prauserella aidingensis]MCP2256293.1 hypothetical protein [Prauserella aidingensis]
MADDASNAGKQGDDFWGQAAFAVKGDKGTATAEGWLFGEDQVTSGAVAGGFMMDPETAEGMVRKANWIVSEMRTNHERAKNLVHSEPPATDPGSESFQSVAKGMFEIGATSMEAQWKRYLDIAEKLQKALDVYHEVDEQAGKDAKKSGGGLIG